MVEVGGVRRATSLKADLLPFGKLPFARESGPRPPRRGGSYESEKGVFQVRHEDRWTSFNDNWRQNASALLSRWCDPVMGGSPPGSAGVPPAQILPQLQTSPPPESTGSGAMALLRPGPSGSRWQCGRVQHRRETERQPKGQHAGETPALPGVSCHRWCAGGYPAGDFSESRPAPFAETPVCPRVLPPPPTTGADHTRVKQSEIDHGLPGTSWHPVFTSTPFWLSWSWMNRIGVIRTKGSRVAFPSHSFGPQIRSPDHVSVSEVIQEPGRAGFHRNPCLEQWRSWI